MDGAEELSPQLPPSLRLPHFVLVLSLAVLLAFIKRGQSRANPFQSVVQLIILDTATYLALVLTSVLLLISVLFTPRDTISVSLIAPLLLFLGLLVYANKTNPKRRSLYALWISAESLCSCTDLIVDIPALLHARKVLAENGDKPKGPLRSLPDLLHIPHEVGANQPILTALRAYHMRSTESSTHTPTTKRPSQILLALLQQSRCVLVTKGCQHEKYTEPMRVITAWTAPCCVVPHPRFGALWHRVTNRTSIDRGIEGAWFIGAEILQSIKHSLGVEYLSDRNFYDNVQEMWKWAARHDVWFRKRLQISPIAEQLAREQCGNVNKTIEFANALAGEGRPGVKLVESYEMRLAVEANLVAVLGLTVGKVYGQLKIAALWQEFMNIFARDIALGKRVIMRSPSEWPQREVARAIITWIGSACNDCLQP